MMLMGTPSNQAMKGIFFSFKSEGLEDNFTLKQPITLFCQPAG